MRISIKILALLLSVVLVNGCDSNDESESDTDILVGTWTLKSISDDEGDKTAVFAAEANSVVITLTSGKTFNLTMDYNAAGEAAGYTDVVLAGTYSVNESTKMITLTVTAIGASLPATYTVTSNDEVRFSAPAALINLLFGGTPNVGTVVIVLERQ